MKWPNSALLLIFSLGVLTIFVGQWGSWRQKVEKPDSVSSSPRKLQLMVSPTHISTRRPPTLGFNISGAEVLLADEQGRRTGYDGETGQLLYEIPYSGYYDSEIVPPGGEPDDVIDRNLRLSDSAAGSYRLTVTGPTVSESALSSQTTSDFQIDIVGFDSQLAVLEAKISGTVLPGETLEYLVTYEPTRRILLIK